MSENTDRDLDPLEVAKQLELIRCNVSVSLEQMKRLERFLAFLEAELSDLINRLERPW
jgi:hypothetical protein